MGGEALAGECAKWGHGSRQRTAGNGQQLHGTHAVITLGMLAADEARCVCTLASYAGTTPHAVWSVRLRTAGYSAELQK